MDFESSLKDPAVAIATDFAPERSILLLAFGGFSQQLGIPIFEFNRITDSFENLNRIFLRDTMQMWYHLGLPGVAENIDGIAGHLREYTGHPSTRRVIVFGNSGGGYAAILFGYLLQADQIHAFAPRTFIHPLQRLAHLDLPRSSPQNMARLYLRGQRKYFDLKQLLVEFPNHKTRYHVYYSAADRIDTLHATRIKSTPHVSLHKYAHGQHDLVKKLKQDGQLGRIIEQALQ